MCNYMNLKQELDFLTNLLNVRNIRICRFTLIFAYMKSKLFYQMPEGYALLRYINIENSSIKKPKPVLNKSWFVMSANPEPFNSTKRVTSIK
jgi:hypothetical protein